MEHSEFVIEYKKLRHEQDSIIKPNSEQILEFKHKHWNLHQEYLTSQLLNLGVVPQKTLSNIGKGVNQ